MQTWRLWLTLVLVLAAVDVGAQSAPPSVTDIWARDSVRSAWLEQHGRTVRLQSVTVIAPRDSVSEEWQRAFADSLDRGVGAVRRLIGGPYPWQRIARVSATPITIYVSPELFAAHGTGRGAVFLPLPRVRSGDAPALREVSHELLVPTCRVSTPCYPSPWERPDTVPAEVSGRFPNWLFWFGIAGFLAHTAADAEGVMEPRVFDGGLAGADRLCTERAAAHPKREELLSAIGAGGSLATVAGVDRRQAATVVYPCTLSITKFLVETVGLPAVIALFPAARDGTWEREVERIAKVPMSELRARWLRQLGLDVKKEL
jgi:hypothetical protein